MCAARGVCDKTPDNTLIFTSQMPGIILLVFTGALLYLGRKLLSFIKALEAFQYHPGNRTLFSPISLIGASLPEIPWISQGSTYLFDKNYQPFESAGWDIITSVGVFPGTRTAIYVADVAAIKEITLSRARFPKPVEQYRGVAFFGHNIVVSEDEEWKKYRKIAAPTFSDRNNRLVWDESLKIVQELFDGSWADQDVITVNHAIEITLPIALFVIGAAGFGQKISWNEDGTIPPGHTMTFKDALRVATDDFVLKLLFPNWALNLTPRLRQVKRGFEELHAYMAEMVRERQAVVEKAERHDLLSSLLEANDHDLDLDTLTEDEIISNIYMFLVAGHETTAHTLCFAFALLALYPNEQDKFFEQIKSVSGGQFPTYEEMPLLTLGLAIFYETLRMFPPVPGIPKSAGEDTSIVASNIRGEKRTIPLLKGTNVVIDCCGVNRNPRHWDNPNTFNPSRFLKDWPRDAFLPFSAGPRACLGRRFSETEAIAVLTMLVSHYKITIKEEPQFASETFEERKSRILSARLGLTMTPVRVPLVFTRRQ